MSLCPNTGIGIPECSCTPCLRAQIERHMPSLLEESGGGSASASPGLMPPSEQQPRAA